MRTTTRWLAALVTGAALLLLAAAPAAAHEERKAVFPAGTGSVPTYRAGLQAQRLVVCTPESAGLIASMTGALRALNDTLLAECSGNSIQDAVNTIAAPGGLGPKSTIYLLPGVYTERKYAAPPTGACAQLQPEPSGDVVGTLQRNVEPPPPGTPARLSYAQQLQCPNVQNLVAILGDSNPNDPNPRCDNDLCGLQIEGTGAKPQDVLLDNQFAKLNALRGDRVDGLYLRNFMVQQASFNSVYVMETDGFVIDRVIARANDEYGFLAFASDHGLIKDCEAYYNGDSGVYPGSASDINAGQTTIDVIRYAIEITGCYSHDNALGYSGTAGNSVYAHDNVFAFNGTGIATDSFFPGHPGLPQDHARFSNNRIFSNNRNYYDNVRNGTCSKPIAQRGYLEKGVVCPVIPAPVGTGILIAGGNFNSVDGNVMYDNWRTGTYQIWMPAPLRDEYDPTKLYDTSNGNQYRGNRMGFAPDGSVQPNGLDSWWDDEGVGNCWQDNVSSWGAFRSNAVDPRGLPTCASGGSQFVPGTSAVKFTGFLGCSQYNRNDTYFKNPPACDWFVTPAKPVGTAAAPAGTGTGGSTAPGASGAPVASGGPDPGVAPVGAVRGRALAATGLGTGVAVGLGMLGLACVAGAVWLRRRPGAE